MTIPEEFLGMTCSSYFQPQPTSYSPAAPNPGTIIPKHGWRPYWILGVYSPASGFLLQGFFWVLMKKEITIILDLESVWLFSASTGFSRSTFVRSWGFERRKWSSGIGRIRGIDTLIRAYRIGKTTGAKQLVGRCQSVKFPHVKYAPLGTIQDSEER